MAFVLYYFLCSVFPCRRLLVPVLCGSQPLWVLSFVLFFGLPLLPGRCASGLRCLVPTLTALFVQPQQPLLVGFPSVVTVCPAPALAVQGVWSQSFVPSCCSCLLSSLGVSAAAFCPLGLLSHPILLLFLAWVSSFGVYSGLGLRCYGPGYGSSLLLFFFFGGALFPFQTEPWSFFFAKKSLVVHRLFCSWDFLLVLLHLVSSIPEPVGSWERFFYSVFFPPLAGSFLRPFLDSWLRLVFFL